MKKPSKKITTKSTDKRFDKIEILIEKLAVMTSNNFERVEHKLEMEAKGLDKRIGSFEASIQGARADILDLHDKFIHRREFDQLSLRVSKLEEKARK